MVMPVTAPVPIDAMRSGRLREAPGIVTRTGRIACTPWLGRSFMARKSQPSFTYGPTFACASTVTGGASARPKPPPLLEPLLAEAPPAKAQFGDGQLMGGGVI